MSNTEQFQRLQSAMFSPAFPCNPLPFLIGLTEHVRENGSDAIETDEAKRVLWVLMAQSYGQLASIDLHDEWIRLEGIQRTEAATDEEVAAA